jgi:hypothetical protein
VSKKDWRIAAGQIGGKAAAAAMTPEERTERARAAVQARWQRARGEDADVDRRQRLHAALDKLCEKAAGDPKLQAKLERAMDTGDLVQMLEQYEMDLPMRLRYG